MKSVITCALLILHLPRSFADAGWPAVTRQLVRAHNEARVTRFDLISGNPFLISLVDHLHLKARGWGGLAPGAETRRVLADSGEFRRADGSPRALNLKYWPGRTGAPLVVYLPGSFQGSTDEDTHRMVDLLRELGNHVLVIPDPLGAEYMANEPVAPPAWYAREAGVITAAIREVAEASGTPRVRLIAASHGAFLAAVTWALDQRAARPVIEDATLLFPQASLNHAIELIDGYIATPLATDAPRALIGRAFQESLRRLVKRLQRGYLRDLAHGFGARRYPAWAAEHLSTYRRSREGRTLNFTNVLTDYVAHPEVLASFTSPRDKLLHWLGAGHAARGAENLRVIIGTDDWTNAPDAWADRPAWLNDPLRWLVVDRAGHAGLVAEDWFRRAIAAAMAWH